MMSDYMVQNSVTGAYGIFCIYTFTGVTRFLCVRNMFIHLKDKTPFFGGKMMLFIIIIVVLIAIKLIQLEKTAAT